MTLLDAILEGLDIASRTSGSETPPAVIVWTDTKSEWLPLADSLRDRLPQLLTFGEYDPDKKVGPAIWLKCAMDRALPKVNIPEDQTPVIYMPGVSRQDLRAGSECPDELQPLIEILYRGTVWTQKNGRDWTVEAMLVAKERPGLGLDVAGDNGTKLSMMASLSVLAETPVARLQGRKLEAEDFDRLMIGDHPRDLLRWMSNPDVVREEMDNGRWHAFCNRCRDEYGFDPVADGQIVAGEKFGLQKTTTWERLWDRFRESPTNYPGLENLLRNSKPIGHMNFIRESWPEENSKDEQELSGSLRALENTNSRNARKEIERLEKVHGIRRSWVWFRLGKAPLAGALKHLVDLSTHTESLLGGDSITDLEKQYVETGYLADDAAIRAIASVKSAADSSAVEAAVRALYMPWLEAGAVRMQKLVKNRPLPTSISTNRAETIAVDIGGCILFADGLRYDLAKRLSVLLAERGLQVNESRRWTALPSVTATAKPSISPVAEQLVGVGMPDSFTPEMREDPGKSLTHPRHQAMLKSAGYQVIPAGETGDPAARQARGWCEFGEIDKRGHDLQTKLATIAEQQVELLADRIVDLLTAGWREVRIVTDHGWLLMPGGLPKQELPHYLTEAKWSRCATIKGASNPNVQKVGWYWNPQGEFATAPGICCFSAGHCYQHGGISLQECLIADLTVSPDTRTIRSEVSITGVDWKGLKCRMTIEPVSSGFGIDLRSKPNDPVTSVASGGKRVDGAGRATLFVENDDLEGTVVAAVVTDNSGQVIAKTNTTIGGE